MSEDVEMRVDLGRWLPEAMEHGNPGLMAARGWTPWPTGGWRPYPAFIRAQVNIGGEVYGGHYHVWGSVWEAYVARANGANVDVTRITLQQGSPPGTLAIGAALDVLGTTWPSQALVDWGYTFVSRGQYVLLCGDETVQMQARDSTGAVEFADMIPPTSIDRPSARFMAPAGLRVVIAYVKHNDATSQANYESDALTDENLLIFSGLKSGYTYWSTRNTADTGTNDWDEEEQSNHYRLTDGLGVITALATSNHGFGWAWKENGLYRFDFQQVPADFRLISDQHGTRSPQSVVVVDDTVYWYDQLGHFCRAGVSGGVEDLSSTSAMTTLLDDDAVFLGRYPETDLTQGKNSAAATAFAWGATSRWKASVDLDAILNGTGIHRYPQGYYDAHSKTIRWIYPGTHDRMTGVGSVGAGQTTFSWTSGTLFDHADNSFMDGRSIDLDDGAHTTTVSSVTDRETLELTAGPVGALTDVTWFISFQRYLELVFQPAIDGFSCTDVTHAWDKTTGQRPWGMHWGISAPGFALRLAQPSDVPQRLSYAPRDVLYGFIYTTTAGTDSYSLTYAWPYSTIAGVDQHGFALLEDPLFVTGYLGIPGQGTESVAESRVAAVRLVYSARQRAVHDLGIDLDLRVVILSKRRAGSQRDSSDAVQGPRVSSEMSFDLDAAVPPGDPRGWMDTSAGLPGQWHQIVFWIASGPFTANDPITAHEVMASIDYLEVRLTPLSR